MTRIEGFRPYSTVTHSAALHVRFLCRHLCRRRRRLVAGCVYRALRSTWRRRGEVFRPYAKDYFVQTARRRPTDTACQPGPTAVAACHLGSHCDFCRAIRCLQSAPAASAVLADCRDGVVQWPVAAIQSEKRRGLYLFKSSNSKVPCSLCFCLCHRCSNLIDPPEQSST